MREAAEQRDGPALWRVVVALAQRRAAGLPVPGRAEQVALDALDEAWFFGLVRYPLVASTEISVPGNLTPHIQAFTVTIAP